MKPNRIHVSATFTASKRDFALIPFQDYHRLKHIPTKSSSLLSYPPLPMIKIPLIPMPTRTRSPLLPTRIAHIIPLLLLRRLADLAVQVHLPNQQLAITRVTANV